MCWCVRKTKYANNISSYTVCIYFILNIHIHIYLSRCVYIYIYNYTSNGLCGTLCLHNPNEIALLSTTIRLHLVVDRILRGGSSSEWLFNDPAVTGSSPSKKVVKLTDWRQQTSAQSVRDIKDFFKVTTHSFHQILPLDSDSFQGWHCSLGMVWHACYMAGLRTGWTSSWWSLFVRPCGQIRKQLGEHTVPICSGKGSRNCKLQTANSTQKLTLCRLPITGIIKREKRKYTPLKLLDLACA